MSKIGSEHEMLREFAGFIDGVPADTSREMDENVLHIVAKDLQPASWKVFGKLTVVEVAAGLVTLTLCPQFGLGFGAHNAFLHRLHAAASPAVFYLLCGMLFVILGAALGGLVLTRHEIRTVAPAKNLYFALYSVLAYVTLVALGPEVFMAGSLTWVGGAMLGNVFGYGFVIRLRAGRGAAGEPAHG
ncbi:hypothetical protein [Desulfuromonas sp. TF]|uniref:hypothetical protein n=1 Tax=Desulfuromonas sp. TF TaxID=1232410 RepID=UPI000419A605|nr:hypothetical protein [Desulfuromonas sp. TF]